MKTIEEIAAIRQQWLDRAAEVEQWVERIRDAILAQGDDLDRLSKETQDQIVRIGGALGAVALWVDSERVRAGLLIPGIIQLSEQVVEDLCTDTGLAWYRRLRLLMHPGTEPPKPPKGH